jgi:hypothetical protein
MGKRAAVLGVIFTFYFCIFNCEARADQLIFDNIALNGGTFYNGFPSTSQLDSGFGFDAGVVDDFVLPASSDPSGDWQIKSLNWSGRFIVGTPVTNMSFNIIVWPSEIGLDIPAGGSEEGMPPDYTAALAIYSNVPATAIANPVGENNFDYSADLPIPFSASDGTTYWLEVQAAQNWPPQWAWQLTLGTHGSFTYSGFAGLLDTIQFWSPAGLDTAFQLYGDPVPEPSTAILGLACGLLMMRRMRLSTSRISPA